MLGQLCGMLIGLSLHGLIQGNFSLLRLVPKPSFWSAAVSFYRQARLSLDRRVNDGASVLDVWSQCLPFIGMCTFPSIGARTVV